VRWQVAPDLHATFNLGGIAASVAGVQLEEPWSTLQQRLEQTLFGTAMGQLKRLGDGLERQDAYRSGQARVPVT